jgi:uncharacterized protein
MTRKRGLRRCLACGAERPAREMLRFVLAPDTQVVFDRKRNLPGRGVNICPDKKCLKIGLTSGKLGRGFKGKQSTFDPQILRTTVIDSYRKKVFSLITMSRISNMLVEGRTVVGKELENGKAALVILAEELAEETAESFKKRARSARIPAIVVGTMQELSGVGEHDRPRAIFAVTDNQMASSILEVYGKLVEISGIADGQS